MPEQFPGAERGSAARLDRSLEAVFDASPIAMVALDSAARAFRYNRAAEFLLGWDGDRLLGSEPRLPGEVLAALSPLPDSAKPGEVSTDLSRTATWTEPDGNPILLTITPTHVFDADGAPIIVLQMMPAAAREPLERLAAEVERLSGLLFRPMTGENAMDVVVREAKRLARAEAARVRLVDDRTAREGDRVKALDARSDEAPTGPRDGDKWTAFPLLAEGRPIADLEVALEPSAILDDDQRLALSTLAALAGQALVRASLFEEADRVRHEAIRTRDQAAALVALTADLSAALTPAEVGRAAMERGLPAVGATSGSLVLLDEAARELAIIAVHGFPEHVLRSLGRISVDDDYPLAEAVRTGKAVYLESAAVWRDRYPLLETALHGADVEALATIPLEVHGRIIGGLRLGFPHTRTFDVADAAYIHALADKCAQAIERSRLFEAERNARLTLETVIDEMPVAVLVAEPPDGRVVLANNQYERIWRERARRPQAVSDFATRKGYGADGRPLEPDDWPLARALSAGETIEGEEIEIERGDGSRGVVLISAAPVRDTAGQIIAAVSTHVDISERRDADLMRDAFLSILSHELRTPITSIYGGIQLLRRPRERVDDETRREVIEDVAAEAERLTRLIEDLLVIARAERGVSTSAADPVLLGHLVPRVVAAERSRWPGTTFVIQAPSQVPAVRGDEGHLEQVLRNLLSNAAKYGPPQGRVDVIVGEGPAEVTVRVVDEGPGIEAGEANDLFRLFYRSPTTSTAAGAGIGLFVTRSLVEAMGGRVWARPRADLRGAEFGIALPVFEDVDDV